MKLKKYLIIAMLSGIALFSACGSDISEPLTRDYETIDGEIQSLGGIKVNKSISHLFESEDDEIYYAYSERYDLDDEEYFGKKIEAYGVIMTFEEIDKKVFEIRRISEVSEDEEEEFDVENVDYQSGLGFTLEYPNNWLKEDLSDSVMFTSPAKPEDPDPENTGVEFTPDFIIIAKTDAVLAKTSLDPSEDRASEIRDFVRSNYDNLVGTSNDLSSIGVDQLFSIKYKAGADISYFVPRNDELFEISFYHPGDDDSVSNGIIFSEILSSFRFIPEGYSEPEESIEEVTEETSSGEQLSVKGYLSFESKPFSFKISYPSSWYYSGGTSGYDFSPEPIEDDTVAIIRLDLSSSGTVGTTKSGAKTNITVKVGDRYYKLSGASEYASIMQTMADSISEIEKTEE